MEEQSIKDTAILPTAFPTIETAQMDRQSIELIAVSINCGLGNACLPSKHQEKVDEQTMDRHHIEQINKLKQQNSQLSTLLSRLQIKRDEKKRNVHAILNELQNGLSQSVDQILSMTRQDLNSLKFFGRPPPLAQLVLKAVCWLLLGHLKGIQKGGPNTIKWGDAKYMLGNDFLRDIAEFRVENVNQEVVDIVQREYLEADEWNLQKIKMNLALAQKFAKWVQYQMLHFECIGKVKRLKMEIVLMQREETELKEQLKLIVESMRVSLAEPLLWTESSLQDNRQIILEEDPRR